MNNDHQRCLPWLPRLACHPSLPRLAYTHEQSYSVDPGDSGRTGCPGWVAAFGVTDRLGLARSGLLCSGLVWSWARCRLARSSLLNTLLHLSQPYFMLCHFRCIFFALFCRLRRRLPSAFPFACSPSHRFTASCCAVFLCSQCRFGAGRAMPELLNTRTHTLTHTQTQRECAYALLVARSLCAVSSFEFSTRPPPAVSAASLPPPAASSSAAATAAAPSPTTAQWQPTMPAAKLNSSA